MTKRRRDRFERTKIIIPILLAGWIPSVLTLIVSYTILRDTLESRITDLARPTNAGPIAWARGRNRSQP